MKRDGWERLIRAAVAREAAGDGDLLRVLVSVLVEQEQAKQQLRDLGFGCIGMAWTDVVEDIREATR